MQRHKCLSQSEDALRWPYLELLLSFDLIAFFLVLDTMKLLGKSLIFKEGIIRNHAFWEELTHGHCHSFNKISTKT